MLFVLILAALVRLKCDRGHAHRAIDAQSPERINSPPPSDDDADTRVALKQDMDASEPIHGAHVTHPHPEVTQTTSIEGSDLRWCMHLVFATARRSN